MDIARYQSMLFDKLATWRDEAVAMLPNFLVAIILLMLALAAARFVCAVLERMLSKVSDSDVVVNIIRSVIRIAIISLGLFAALQVLHLEKTVTSLLAGAGIVGLAIGFAFQDLASNFIAGFLMGIRKPFRKGDVIETAEHYGTVRKMNLRNTLIENFDGQMVIIPNKDVFQNAVKNYSYTGRRRITVDVGVRYDADLDKVHEVTMNAIRELPILDKEKEPGVYAREFGESSINFRVFYWIRYPGETGYFEAIHQGVVGIKKAFDREGIVIPFPIRTLEIDPDGSTVRVEQLSGRNLGEG